MTQIIMSSDIQQDRENLLAIIKSDAYFKEKVVLSSGSSSDYYIDARRVTLGKKGCYLSAKLILDLIKDEQFDAIGGPTLGADPMIGAISVLCYQEKKPINTFIIRKEPKKHGKQQQIEGPDLKEGARVILIDDVATTGKAFVQSIDVLKQLSIDVVKCVCIADRNEGAKEAVSASGSELISVFDISEIHQ